MPFTLTMPKMSPTMEEGMIAQWHKKVGDHVEAGDHLFDVATDKATVEYNALDSGWLRKILVGDGKEARVNDPIAILTEKKEESIEGYKPEAIETKAINEPGTKSETPPLQKNAEKESAPPLKPASTPVVLQEPIPTSQRIFASPLAKKLAKEKGLDLTTLKGTGPRGRIMSRDLEGATLSLGVSPKGKPNLPAGAYEEETLTPMRKSISKRLQEAKSTIPHFYVSLKVDAKALMEMREQLKNFGIKVTYNDFIVCACALALRDHPNVNSGFNAANNSLIRYKTIDISIAVTIPNGLITPIIRHADYKSITEISQEVKYLSTKAKEGKLQEQDYKGGSFTISNLGMYGVSDFVAIINPPQAAILAVSSILEVPVVRNGQILPGHELTLTLSGDHRVIDGVSAAEFLTDVKKFLENPARLLIS